VSEKPNRSDEKWIRGVLHTFSLDDDWKPLFNITIYKIGIRIIQKMIIIAFILTVILVEEYRNNIFSLYGFPFENSPNYDARWHPIFSILAVYVISTIFYFVLGHSIQDTYADTDPETGMKKLLPFKLALTKFVLGVWVVNLYYSFILSRFLGIESLGLTLLIFFPMSITMSISMVYIERFEYNKVKAKWTANLENE